MKTNHLILKSLQHYWRTNLAVVLGVATGVAVLSGALLIGDSVRGTLRELVVQRLGNTDQIVTSETYFREEFATDIERQPAFSASFDGIAPMTVGLGMVTEQETRRRAGQV